jgi:hypothetical protein
MLSKMIVSKDVEAVDACATTLFNLNPRDVRPIVAACKQGHGVTILNKIIIVLRLKSDIN